MDKFIDFNHLKEVNSGYFKHMFIALYLVWLLFLSFITGLIHAIFPFLFPFTPYHLAKKVVTKTEEYFLKDK